MRLAFITCHFPPESIGGGQVQSMRLCEALSQKYDVTVFTRAYRKDIPLKEDTGSFLLYRRRVVKIPVLKSIIDLIQVLAQIRAHKKEIQIFLSFHIQLAALMVILAKLLYRTRAVVSPRGYEDFNFKWHKRGFQKFIYSRADVILIQSEKIKESFCSQLAKQFSLEKQNLIKARIRIFPNGIAVPKHIPQKISDRPDEIVFVGRLEPIKGVATLLEAFKSCTPQLHLKIIGDGSQRNYLQSMASGLNVSFLGMCKEPEIREHLKNAKALILPSLSENFPNVILEAFCAGIPVIATNVGAIPELIEDGVNGFLVRPSVPSDLCEKIKVLFTDKDRLDEMGIESYQKVHSYNWSHLVDRFEVIIAN